MTSNTSSKVQKTNLLRTILAISGHNCTNCNQSIYKLLKSQPLIRSESIHLELMGRLEFLHEDSMDLNKVIEGLNSLGLDVTLKSSGSLLIRYSGEEGKEKEKEDNLKLDLVSWSQNGDEPEETRQSDQQFDDQSNKELTDITIDKDISGINLSGSLRNTKSVLTECLTSSTSLDHTDILELVISGMTCASCVSTIESNLSKVPGVFSIKVHLLTGRAMVEYDPVQIGVRTILESIRDYGYDAEMLVSEDNQQALTSPNDKIQHDLIQSRKQFLISLIFAIPAFLVDMIFMMTLPPDHPIRLGLEKSLFVEGLTIGTFITFILATGIILVLGLKFYKRAYKAFWSTLSFNMDCLVTLGTLVAYFSSIGMTIHNITVPSPLSNHHHTIESNPTTENLDIAESMLDETMTNGYHPSFEISIFLITFILLGKFLENLAKKRTFSALKGLVDLNPDRAVLLVMNKDGKGNQISSELEIDLALIQVGDLLKVIPGSKIPCDGEIVLGATTIDESMLTGEYLPTSKSLGDTVIGGTTNLSSMVWVKATRVGRHTTLHQIIELVLNGQRSKAPIEQLADKISSIFVPIVMLLSLVTVIIWLVVGSLDKIPDKWIPYGITYPVFSLFLGVSVLVIACPCAMGLASPTAVMVGTGLAARHGILVRGGGASLEMAHRINCIAFDKTGTLTHGKPIVTDVQFLTTSNSTEQNESDQNQWMAQIAIWDMILVLEASSNHPLAKAVVQHAKMVLSISDPSTTVNTTANNSVIINDSTDPIIIPTLISHQTRLFEFEEVAGLGVKGLVRFDKPIHLPLGLGTHNQFQIVVGNLQWMEDNEFYPTESHVQHLINQSDNWASKGSSILYIAIRNPSATTQVNGTIFGCLGISDSIRPESKAVIQELKRLNIEVWMMTGDSNKAAQFAAKSLGIDNVISKVLPSEKADRIKWLQTRKNLPDLALGSNKKGDSLRLDKSILGRAMDAWGLGDKKRGRRTYVAMVGDGINDSPALSQSDLGIAMGSGTTLALHSSDAILIKSKLTDLITLLLISRRTTLKIQQNFLWALIYNILAIPFAAGLLYPILGIGIPPPLAAALMTISSLSVMVSSLFIRVAFSPFIVPVKGC